MRTQLGRRNLSNFHKNKIALRYKDVLAKKAKEHSLSNLKQNNNSPKASNEVIGKNSRYGKTAKQLADIAGTSEASITRTQTNLEKGSPEDIQEVEMVKPLPLSRSRLYFPQKIFLVICTYLVVMITQ